MLLWGLLAATLSAPGGELSEAQARWLAGAESGLCDDCCHARAGFSRTFFCSRKWNQEIHKNMYKQIDNKIRSSH